MVHFLRTKDNRTIIECDVYNDDLDSSIDVSQYSKLLLNEQKNNPGGVQLFILNFTQLYEVRRIWWENIEFSKGHESIDDFVKDLYVEVAKLYDLNYVND